jgi:adenylate cyclase
MQPMVQPTELAKGTQRTPTILVIEDNDNLRMLLAQQLTFFQLNPVCMQNGIEGLKWLEENEADLVVLDWMLPDMEGIDVCREIRKSYSASALPVLMLSALGRDVDRRVNGLKAGANDFMAKPYEVTELVARIQSQLAVKSDQERTEDLLSNYTTRMLREQVKLDPQAVNRRELREAVILFADLRGFTELTASSHTEDTVALLDRFFEEMMQVVGKYNGCVLDLAGDEMLVTFNLPDPVPQASEHAMNAALEMQHHFATLREEWQQSGIDVGLGIGIHQGEVMLGNMGGSELRRYTVIGNAVNIAHRFVEIAGDGEIIISPELYQEVHPALEGVSVERHAATLKGVDGQQSVYRIAVQNAASQPRAASGGLLGRIRKLMK